MSTITGKKSASSLLRAAPLLAIVATGCGGAGRSGAGSLATSGTPSTTRVGNAEITFSGSPKTLLSGSSGQVAYVAQAGAAYSALTMYPTPSLASTFLAYTRNLSGGGSQLYTASASSAWQPNLLVHQSNNGYISIDQNGLMAYLTQAAGVYAIKTIMPDGTQSKTVLPNQLGIPAISPNGALIAYLDGKGNIFTVPVSGGTPTKIYAGGNALASLPVWSPNSSQIAFSAAPTAGATTQIFTIPATGGTATNVTPSGNIANGDTYAWSWSPDGQTLACMYEPKAGNTSLIDTISLTGGLNNQLTPSTFNDVSPCFSPDGQKIAFYRSNAGGATPGIYIEDFVGANPQLVIPDPSTNGTTGPVVNIAWSPFLENEKFVGSGGSISATAVSGFVLTQIGNQFGSLLTMTATTPSKATITGPTGGSTGGPILLTLGADAITNVSFTNVYNGSHTSIAFTTTPTILASVDGTTGMVDFLAAGKILHHAPPSVTTGRSQIIGQFSAIYDANGKNVAPSGASMLEVDAKTGNLVSFH